MDNLCCFSSVYSQVVGGRSSCSSGKGRSHQGPVKYGFSLVKGKANHPMEDFHVAKFVHSQGHELGLFAIYDGHLGDSVPAYLQKHLFPNILKDEEFWTDPNRSISKAYERTDQAILSHSPDLGRRWIYCSYRNSHKWPQVMDCQCWRLTSSSFKERAGSTDEH
ncbi:unnamed protein product [Prunus armeniaca]|uniref:PPM-type phosphatase domain-containing protein n=1 Tax=Prunus armeniaca TaxID=36596 RepID=A0A6J5VKV0_PRUAR|nr:unnamed protein product [Prunus armeniaca]